jgi:NAD(P)-dependent dehydrogenase (short-subunit alcohol dehydrogenase family)
VLTVTADVTRPSEVAGAVAAAVERFGKLDVLFSNAGNFGTVQPIDSYPVDVFDAVYAVHVKGAFLMCQHAVPHMNDGGSIIITSSVAGTRGDPGVYAYITAKHAQVGLMRCLAKELAPRNIRVNTIHPGPIDNGFQSAVEHDLGQLIGRNATAFFDEQIPLGRHASPAEVARSALYLASDLSSFTTGSMLMVDGGMSA